MTRNVFIGITPEAINAEIKYIEIPVINPGTIRGFTPEFRIIM